VSKTRTETTLLALVSFKLSLAIYACVTLF